jgi:hypothetical protein
MNGISRVGSIVAVVSIAALGCAAEESDIETEQSALVSFGSWTSMTSPVLDDGPALAFGPSLTAYGLKSVGKQIFVTNQNGAGNWTGSWSQLSNSGAAFATRPSATAFPGVTTGSLAGKFAIVAMRDDGSKQYFLTIRDQTGTVVEQDWIAVPGGIFASAPAITFVPPSPPNGPSATLVLAGRGTDARIWVATNSLRNLGAGFVYENNRWGGFHPVPDQNGKQFTGSPAITYAVPAGSSSTVLILAARDFIDGSFYSSKFNGTSWSAWVQVANGTFIDGPALGTGFVNNNGETTIFGTGMDSHIYYSTQLSGGAAGFTAIGTETFVGSPQAVGTQVLTNHGKVWVAGIKSGGSSFSNAALSP